MSCGHGVPGPVFLMAVAAGLWAGPVFGLFIGTVAGLVDAILGSQAFIPITLLTMLCATAAGFLPRWVSRRHLLIGLLAAFVSSFLAGAVLALLAGRPMPALFSFAVRRACENALWMIPIYGIVLVISFRRSDTVYHGDRGI